MKINFFSKTMAALAVAAFTDMPSSASAQTVVDVAIENNFNTLVAAVQAAGLVEALSDTDAELTVFAPTDEAFTNVNVTMLLEDQWRAHLTSVLLYHVLPVEVESEALEVGLTAETLLEGEFVNITSLDPPQVNNAEIIMADVEAENGIIHVIDDVLLPTSMTSSIVDLAVATPELSTLVDLVTMAELADVLATGGPFTVLAPNNGAFDKLDSATVTALTNDPTGALADVLLYHVVPGIVLAEDLVDGATVQTVQGSNITVSLDPVKINDASVVLPDVLANNGVVHVIDTVLVPPPPPEESPSEEVSEQPTDTIVDLAVATPELSTLVSLVTQAGLVDTLATGGPFTVFAPSNAAFDKVPAETLTALGEDVDALTQVLLYHVVEGTVLAEDLTDGQMVTTLNGAEVEVSIGRSVKINDAKVVIPDVLASNGVVHVIDAVLLPPETAPAAGYQRLESTDFSHPGNACMEVKDGVTTNGQRVMLGDCTAAKGGWRLDDNDRFHTELDDDYCLQAGYGDAHNMVGLVLRIQRCDEHNHLQVWKFRDGVYLSPSLDDDLCVVWRGTTPNIGIDPMILIDCAHAGDRDGWTLA